MAKTLETNTDILKYCNDLSDQGKELKLCWEGGNDSGWAWFEIDGIRTENDPHIDSLVDMMYDELDYGSWAGDFDAAGEAIYSKEEEAFVGIDNYCESDSEYFKCNLTIKIPKSLWFDQFELNIQDEDAHVNAFFHVKNGFLTPEHDRFLKDFEVEFTDKVDDILTEFQNDPNTGEFRGMWENFMLSTSEFTEDGDYRVYTIDEMTIGTKTSDEKHIYMQLTPITDYND